MTLKNISDNDTYKLIVEKIIAVGNEHTKCKKTMYPETTTQEQEILNLVNSLIDDGYTEAYPMKALLVASNNWSTFLFARDGFYRDILLEGIEKGCLAHDNGIAWNWMEIAATNNDPELFMDDMDEFYNILADAAEAGNTIALDIMNSIWEPENIIEED